MKRVISKAFRGGNGELRETGNNSCSVDKIFRVSATKIEERRICAGRRACRNTQQDLCNLIIEQLTRASGFCINISHAALKLSRKQQRIQNGFICALGVQPL